MDVSKVELINLENLRSMVLTSNGTDYEWKPIAVLRDENIYSQVYWKSMSEEEVRKSSQNATLYPEIYLSCDRIISTTKVGRGDGLCMFNKGFRNLPLPILLKEIYQVSQHFFPIAKTDMSHPCNHNMLKIFHLLLGVSHLFIKMQKEKYPTRIFEYAATVKDMSEFLIENMWIKDGNLRNIDPSNLFQEIEVRFSPILAFPFPFRELPILKDLYWNMIFREIGKKILSPKRVSKTEHEIKKSFGIFEKIESVIRFFCSEGSTLPSISSIQSDLIDIINWFEKHKKWPTMIWVVDNLEKYIKQERMLELDCYDEDNVQDFEKKVDVTGSAWWPQPEEDGIFANKPFAIFLKWRSKRLLCRIAFTSLVECNHGNIEQQCTHVNALYDDVQRNRVIREIPEALKEYMERLIEFRKKGMELSPGMLLDKTIFYHDGITNKTVFRLSIYNGSKLKISRSFVYGCNSSPSNLIIREMLHEYFGPLDKQYTWEVGLIIISLYKHLFKLEPTHPDKKWKLTYFLNEYRIYNADRIYIYPYKGGWIFSLLCSYIFCRDHKKIPTLEELVNSKFFKKWVYENDLYRVYNRFEMDLSHPVLSQEEYNEFYQISILTNMPPMIEESITLESEWRNTDDMENCLHIIKSFTHHLKHPNFRCVSNRNRHQIPLSFTMYDNEDYLEEGEGKGVFQEGLTLYCKALEKTGLFDRKSKGKTMIAENLNNNHWFVLGLLMAHAFINHYSFFIDQPKCFFKMLIEGVDSIDLDDIADIDREEGKNLLRLFFLSEEELDELFLSMEDHTLDPLICGKVHPGNVSYYVSELCKKKILSDYTFVSGNPRFGIEEMRRGFHITVVDTKASWRYLWMLFTQSNQLNPDAILHKITFAFQKSIIQHDTNCCIKNKHILKSGGLCPVSCLAEYIRNSDQQRLKKLIHFITGSDYITKSPLQDITIHGIEVDGIIPLPVATTCVRTMTIYYNPEQETTEQDSFKEFEVRLNKSIEEGMGFGVK